MTGKNKNKNKTKPKIKKTTNFTVCLKCLPPTRDHTLTSACYKGKVGAPTSSTDLEASIFLTFPISSYKSIIGFVD